MKAVQFQLNISQQWQQSHDGIDRLAYKLYVWRGGCVDLKPGKHGALGEWVRLVTQKRVIIAQKLVVHWQSFQAVLVFDNYLQHAIQPKIRIK